MIPNKTKADYLQSLVIYQQSLLKASLDIIKESCGADSYEYKQISTENQWAVDAFARLEEVELIKAN